MGGIVKSVSKVFKSATKVVSGVIGAVSGIANKAVSWLIPQPSVPDYGSFSSPENLESARGILINKSSNNAPIPIIYGTRQVGGTRVYLDTGDAGVNNYLYMCLVLAEGEIDSIQEIQIDDKVVTWTGALTHGTLREVSSSDSNFYKFNQYYNTNIAHIRVRAYMGKDDQTACPLLKEQAVWTDAHRLRGVAYLSLRFIWNQDIFSGIPDVKVTVKGKKVYDPRTGTTAYSTNSALCLLDYLRNTRYGKGLSNSAFETNFQSFQDSADDCETQVTPYSGGSTIDLATTNAVLDTSQKVIDNVQKLLNPMRAIFSYNQGAYILKIEKAGTATKTITSDNVIGGIQIIGEKKSKKYNRCIGTFVNPSKGYQEDTVSFPPADDSGLPSAERHATLLAEDNNVLLEGNFNFPCVTNPYQAEELCEIILKRSRNALAINVTLTSEFLDLIVGDIVNVTYSTASFSAKPFRVMGLTINIDSTVTAELIEHQNDFYDYSNKNQSPIIADTSLPNPSIVQKPSISVADEVVELFDGSVVSKLVVTITNVDVFADQFEVEYKESSETNYRLMRRGTNQIVEKYPVKEGAIYNIRARTINALGVKSAYTSANHEVVTAFIPPQDVTNYSIDVVGDKLHHTFDAVSDLDLDYYEIRFTSDTTETSYSNTTVLVPRIARPATSVVTPFVGTGKFFIKAVDKFGVRSANADSVVIDDQVFEGFKAVQTITEEPTFDGTKTNCIVVDNSLILDTSNLFDDTSGNFDDATGLFDAGFGSVNTSGSYEFNTGFDFSNKFKFKVLLNELNVDHLDYVDSFDAQQGLFDDKQGNFDGGTSQAISTNVQLQIALSDDNVSFGSFQNFKSGDYVARAVKFKALLTTTDTSATPKINNLSLKFVLPTVVQDGSNIASGTDTAGKSVTFDNAFYQVPTITIIGQDLNTGDFFQLNSKDRSSFNVEFFDSGGNTVDRQFDFQAVGIGSQQ